MTTDILKRYLGEKNLETCGHYTNWPDAGYGKEFSFYKHATRHRLPPCRNPLCTVCPAIHCSFHASGATSDDDDDHWYDGEDSPPVVTYHPHTFDTLFFFNTHTPDDRRGTRLDACTGDVLAACNGLVRAVREANDYTFSLSLALRVPWSPETLERTGVTFYDARQDWNLAPEALDKVPAVYTQTGCSVAPRVIVKTCDAYYIHTFTKHVKPALHDHLDKITLTCVDVIHFPPATPAIQNGARGQAIVLKLSPGRDFTYVRDALDSVLAEPRYRTTDLQHYPWYRQRELDNEDFYHAIVAYTPVDSKDDMDALVNRELAKKFFKSLLGQSFGVTNWVVTTKSQPDKHLREWQLQQITTA